MRVTPSKKFIKGVKGLNTFDKEKLEKQLRKILKNPCVGKPLKYRRGERALYVRPFRLVYAVRGDEVILLNFDHRKRVYKK